MTVHFQKQVRGNTVCCSIYGVIFCEAKTPLFKVMQCILIHEDLKETPSHDKGKDQKIFP